MTHIYFDKQLCKWYLFHYIGFLENVIFSIKEEEAIEQIVGRGLGSEQSSHLSNYVLFYFTPKK